MKPPTNRPDLTDDLSINWLRVRYLPYGLSTSCRYKVPLHQDSSSHQSIDSKPEKAPKAKLDNEIRLLSIPITETRSDLSIMCTMWIQHWSLCYHIARAEFRSCGLGLRDCPGLRDRYQGTREGRCAVCQVRYMSSGGRHRFGSQYNDSLIGRRRHHGFPW